MELVLIKVSIDKKPPFKLTRSDLFTKSALARKLNCSPTWVNELIEKGRVVEIAINGGSFVFIDPKKIEL